MRLLFEVDCLDVPLETTILCKSFLTKLTLMRLLFEVDCSDVLLEFAFLWKSILATHTHEASLSGGLQRCAFGYGLSLKIYFGKTHPRVPIENCTVTS